MQKWEYAELNYIGKWWELIQNGERTVISTKGNFWCLVYDRKPEKRVPICEYLNKLGEEVWELVTTTTHKDATYDTKYSQYIFKRPKVE